MPERCWFSPQHLAFHRAWIFPGSQFFLNPLKGTVTNLRFKHYLAAILLLGLAAGDLPTLRGDDGHQPATLLAKGKSGSKGGSKGAPQPTPVSLSGTVKTVLPTALTIQVAKSGKSSKSKSSTGYTADQNGTAYMECSSGKSKSKSPKPDSGVWTVYPKPRTIFCSFLRANHAQRAFPGSARLEGQL